MAFAVSTDMRADWTQKDAQVRTTVTSMLSAQQQHITIRYPEENYVGFYNDGVYNVTIATPDGVVYKKDRPNKNAAPATAGAYGYMCFDRCEDAEEDKSSSGTDTRYRNVDICMKPVTTLDEYLNFWVRVQFDLYIDCTGDTPKGTPIHVDKTFGYAELSAENLQLPEIKSIQWQYGEPKSTLMIQASDLTNGWTPIISYYDSKDKDTEIMNWALPTFIAKFDDVGEYDRDRTAILYKVARKEFSYNRSVLTRYIKDYHSIITLGRRELGNFRATQAAGGIELRWGITSGTPGGKVLIERQQLPGGDKVAVAEMKDNTLTYMDTGVDPATFIGNYYITYKGAYESSYDEKKRCQIVYFGSNSVPYCVLQGDVVTYY